MSLRRCGRGLLPYVRSITSSTECTARPLNFVNGERVPPTNTDPSQEFDVHCPATGQKVQRIPHLLNIIRSNKRSNITIVLA